MADFVNPYNFVRLRQMDANARQTPVWHSAADRPAGVKLHSGRLTCKLVALSPIFIPDHGREIQVNLPPFMKKGKVENRRDKHKVYKDFFSQGDGRPVIPGTSLKGVIRAVAEAAANGCLGIFQGQYEPRAGSNKVGKDNYLNPFDMEPAVKALHLQPCTTVTRVEDDPDTGLCPTCRLFGMPAGEEGVDRAGMLPNFFAGKVSIGDATLEGSAQYGDLITLAELASPDPTSYLYYSDLENKVPRGRKFYYHRAELLPDGNQELALKLINALETEGNNAAIFRETQDKDDGLGRKSTVRPLKPESTFSFEVHYENLTDEEFDLLLFALELNPTLEDDGSRKSYHKIGYGKPAGLGSARIIVTHIHAVNHQARYLGEGDGIRTLERAQIDKVVLERRKSRFIDQEKKRGNNLNDLRWILKWPADDLTIRYPKFPDEFKDNPNSNQKKYMLPYPGKEPGRKK